MDLVRFKIKPLLGIVRGIELGQLEPVLASAIAGGLETLEITMNTARAPELIARASEIAAGKLTIGAGTVLDLDDLNSATDAGATFIVSPTLVPEVVAACVEARIAVFPGALTPQEIHDAWRAGASMVKVFPAGFFGPSYFSEIKGPFANIELLACGGVSASTLGDYARCGADAFAFGGSVFNLDWIRAGHYDRIEAAIRKLVAALPSDGQPATG
ncbi:MAG: bifunctional 4-hydroxy-2-oxoglutarate aldolase/2-dehydro-3-deoxy-phosphogluconate aldolase [Myxococcota bacterium]